MIIKIVYQKKWDRLTTCTRPRTKANWAIAMANNSAKLKMSTVSKAIQRISQELQNT